MIIFAVASLKLLLQAGLSLRCKMGRKVRTAQSNAPVKSRVFVSSLAMDTGNR